MMKRVFLILCVFAILLFFAASEWLSRMGYGPQNSVYAEIPQPASVRQLSDEEAMPPDSLKETNRDNTPSDIQLEVNDLSQNKESASSSEENRFGESVFSDPALDYLISLYSQFANQYIKPGWLHFIYKEEHPEAQSSSEYKDIIIPATYLLETWYQLDSSLNVIEGVTIMYSEEGNVIQVSVYQDRVWHNLTLEEDYPVDQAPSIRLDSLFISQTSDAISNGGQVSETLVTVNNQNLTRFGYVETYDPAILVNNLSAPVKASQRYAYFDNYSRHLVILETTFTNLNGLEITTLRTILQVIENRIPPEDILNLLEEIQ